MTYTEIIQDVESLPHYRSVTCREGGHQQEFYILEVQGQCESCKRKFKLRGYAGIGSEIEDVIDAVLAWLGTREELELALERKNAIDAWNEAEKGLE
jgi:hypothetical protein